jgi:hypothetical protein
MDITNSLTGSSETVPLGTALVPDKATSSGMGDGMSNLTNPDLIRQQYKLKSDIAAKEEAQKRATTQREAQVYKQFDPELSKPMEEFKPSPEKASSLGELGLLLTVAGTLMGGKGLGSATGAMNAMAGMLNGYKQGRDDLYQREKDQFAMHMNAWEKNRQIIKDTMERHLKMAAAGMPLSEATTKAAQALHAQGSDVLATSVKTNGISPTLASYNSASSNVDNKLQSSLPTLKQQLSGIEAELAARKAQQEEKMSALTTRKTEAEIAKAERESGPTLKAVIDGKNVYVNRDGKPILDENGQMIEIAPTGGRSSALAESYATMQTTAASEIAAAVGRFDKLPFSKGTIFGDKPSGLFSAPLGNLANEVTPESAQLYNNEIKNIGFNMARLVGGGRGATEALIKDFQDSSTIVPSDTGFSALQKIALIRQKAENAINSDIASKNTSPELKEILKQDLSIIQKSIPFTVDDVLDARSKAQKGKAPETFTQFANKKLGGFSKEYKSTAEVKSSFDKGELSRDEASKILREKFGVQ